MSSSINWQPNSGVRKPTLFEFITTVPLAIVSIPLGLGWVCVRRLFTRDNRNPLKEDLFLSTLRLTNHVLPLSIRRQFLGAAKPDLVLGSNRYTHAKSELLQPVVRSNFAGVWICRGPAPITTSSTTQPSPPSTPQDCDIVILWFFGGAYVLGSPFANAVQLLRTVELAQAQQISCAVFASDYSLAPETPFPAQTDQALAAYRYLVDDQNIDPAKIIVAGVSAGGHLTLSLLHRIAHLNAKNPDSKLPKPGGAFLICPWTDLTNSYPSMTRNAKVDMLTKSGLDRSVRNFFGNDHQTISSSLLKQTETEMTQIIDFASPPPAPQSTTSTSKPKSTTYIPLPHLLPASTRMTIGTHDLFIDGVSSFARLAEAQGYTGLDFDVTPAKYHAWELARDVVDQPKFLRLRPGQEVDEGLLTGSRYIADGVVGLVRQMRKGGGVK